MRRGGELGRARQSAVAAAYEGGVQQNDVHEGAYSEPFLEQPPDNT